MPKTARLFALCLAMTGATFELAGQGQLAIQQIYKGSTTNDTATCLIEGGDGNYYGTKGGSPGQIFRMTPAGTITVLSFQSTVNPELTLADDGNIYGTTAGGGLGYGTIFRVTPAGQVTTVYSFSSVNRGPVGLRKGGDGGLYGATSGSGADHIVAEPITIFQFTTNGTFTTLYSVTNTAGFTSSPVRGSNGYLYGNGTIEIGFTRAATIYQLSTSGTLQFLRRLTNATVPGGLIFGSDGALYGPIGPESRLGPTNYQGGIFRITTTGDFTNLVTFAGSNGANPSAGLCLANDGTLYGSTAQGGVSNAGTIFRITTNGDLTTLVQFMSTNGSAPQSPLIEGPDGNFYGTTDPHSPPVPGIIFRVVQPPQITQISFSNGMPLISWNSFTDGIYRLEYKSALSDLNWSTSVARVTATDLTITAPDTVSASAQRFYRVVLLP